MRDYTGYTHEQLVQEVSAKHAANKKFRAALSEFHATIKSATTQIDGKTAECSSLTQQLTSRTQEWQQLQSELKAVADLHEQAVESAATHQRKACRLDQDFKLEQRRSALLEKGKKQVEEAKAELEMRHQQQASDIAAMRKELIALQSVLKNIQQQQQTDHHAIGQLSTGKPEQSLAVQAQGAPACEDCSAAHRVVANFRQRLEVLEAANAVRDSKQAQSLPSTQDHSGDTNDDRGLRSDVDNIFRRLRTCEQSHRGVAEQINSWRTLFSAAGTSVACQQQDASEQMQISPVGAEGSNVMPGQPARAEAAEVRRHGVQNSLLTHVGRDGTPHAGSTAGDAEDIARHDTLGAGSDCLSDVIGTSPSLMQAAAVTRPYAAVHVRPPHAIDGTNRAITHLHNKIIAEQAAADSPKVTSPKRKAIALEPGPVQANPARKRRKQGRAVGEQQQAAQPQVHPTQTGPGGGHSVVPPRQRQGVVTAKHACSKAFLTRFGIEHPDATVVDFLELQLGRVTHAHHHPEDEDMAEVVSLVAHDIHSGWVLQECPLECITAQFVTSITNCAAAPLSHDSGLHPTQPGDPSERESSPEAGEADEAAFFEDTPLARLWCSPAARKHHILTWLLHCASQLDTLLSTFTQAPGASQPAAEPAGAHEPLGSAHQPAPAAASQPPSEGHPKKRRGRPPGSKNKKTLQKLEAQGLAPSSLGAQPACSRPQGQKQQQQQHEASGGVRAAKTVSESGPQCLQQLDFLTGLHKKVLQALGEACDPKRSGPFEAEVCCLSAAAALLCRVMGKVQPVSAQIVDVLRSSKLPACSKLQCAAAALEQHSEALVTALPGDEQKSSPSALSLVDLCCHAALQSLSEQTSRENRPADATAAAALASAEAGELVTGVSGRLALAVQSWSHNKLTQAAAAQLQGQYREQWEQLQQDCSEGDGAPAVNLDSGGASKLWAVAEAAILAQLHSMGVADGTRDDASEQSLWQVTQIALDIAIIHLGWEWAYYKVVDQGVSHALAGLLQSPSEDWSHASVAMKHLLTCLKHVTHCMASVFTESPGAWSEALQNLAGRLKLLAQNPEVRQHLQQMRVQGLLICTADELLEIKADHTSIRVSNAQQTCGKQQPEKYDHMDVEVEEI